MHYCDYQCCRLTNFGCHLRELGLSKMCLGPIVYYARATILIPNWYTSVQIIIDNNLHYETRRERKSETDRQISGDKIRPYFIYCYCENTRARSINLRFMTKFGIIFAAQGRLCSNNQFRRGEEWQCIITT